MYKCSCRLHLFRKYLFGTAVEAVLENLCNASIEVCIAPALTTWSAHPNKVIIVRKHAAPALAKYSFSGLLFNVREDYTRSIAKI